MISINQCDNFLQCYLKSKVFNPFPNKPRIFTCLQYKSFENTVGKDKIACNEHFLLFPLFSTHLENYLTFSTCMKLLSANSLSLEEPKISYLGKG